MLATNGVVTIISAIGTRFDFLVGWAQVLWWLSGSVEKKPFAIVREVLCGGVVNVCEQQTHTTHGWGPAHAD